MASKIIIVIFQIIVLSFQLHPTKARTWIKAAYYWPDQKEFPISNINSSLFTHLIYAFADIDSTFYNLSFSLSSQKRMSNFTDTVRKNNPSVITLLSIGGDTSYSTRSSMANDLISREYFINSSIETARFYGFQGLDFYCFDPGTSDDAENIGLLFKEWRAAITSEARNSARPELILTAMVNYFPTVGPENYPVGAIRRYLDWVHVNRGDYFIPDFWTDFTAAPVALYNPNSTVNNTDYGIRSWIDAGLSPEKMVLLLLYYGYAWTLVNPNENGIGAPARGPAQINGLAFKEIKNHINQYGAKVTFDANYVVNYFTMGTSWIAFDDVQAIQYKVSYAKKMKLLGYYVWQASYDDNWVLSQTAAQVEDINFLAPVPEEYNRNGQNKQPYRLLEIILPITAAVILLLGFLIYYKWLIKLKSKGSVNSVSVHEVRNQVNNATADAGDFSGNARTLELYSLDYIEVATNNFSSENKLGEGGYGPVYKGVLQNGQEVAVKKLSKTSRQGFEEFKNEVMLTAKLQHVNLVKLLGYCIEKEEHILIYEYMPNRSLDYYLFDMARKYILDWEKRIQIIEGICQELLYLQEYSRLTIIHRDLKASNILLDKDMNPKISDFGIARIFTKGLEANTERIVGTYGYAPPEYIERGIYSTKFDVYSFGILVLQIISGKKVSNLHGKNRNMSLLQYAYELWQDGKGMEFVDPSLDDTYSHCRSIRCLHIGLLCVQEVPIDRPSMLEVSWMLRNEGIHLMIPKKPALSKRTDVQSRSSTSNSEMCSNNDITVSSLEAR